MRNILFAAIVFAVFLPSCKKDDTDPVGAGYIKALESDIDVAVVGNVLLSDNSLIVVCRSLKGNVPGYMYKLDSKGNLVWKKRLSVHNTGLWQVFDLPGNGFACIGYGSKTNTYFDVCQYDDHGNFLSTKQIPFNMQWYDITYLSPFQMIQLSNGNFAFAGNSFGEIVLFITNGAFDTLSRKLINLQEVSFVRGLCEMPDSSIAISTSASFNNPSWTDYYWNTYIIRTDLNGNKISQSVFGDSLHNETPGALCRLGGNLLAVTGRMGQMYDGSGTFVGYLGSVSAFGNMCSGEINLVQLTSGGQFISRQGIRDYPENGTIMTARSTQDGGFILCGAVNQADETSIVSPTKMYIMKVNSSGNYEWSKTINTTYPSIGVDAIQTPDGGYFVSGYENVFGKRYNAIVIKTDRNGNY